ncbi:unnamed protein product [Auanema sp. JU1783]|nr:unnamed protein product [Auanema sp. JU1783]
MGRSSLASVTDARKSRNSLGICCPNKSNKRASIDVCLSPRALAKKLEEINDRDLEKSDAVIVELSGFDNSHPVTTEEYQMHREAVRKLASDPENFDVSGKTELNIEDAALAGAKLLVNENRTTRRLSKLLKERCGIEDEEVLYKPLPLKGREKNNCEEMQMLRNASVVESFVDFKKQLEFKSNVLQYVENGIDKRSKSEGRVATRKQLAQEKRMNQRKRKNPGLDQKTPKCKKTSNPLDCHMIIDKYVLEVASDIREFSKKRRRIAPIPFDLDILDDDL